MVDACATRKDEKNLSNCAEIEADLKRYQQQVMEAVDNTEKKVRVVRFGNSSEEALTRAKITNNCTLLQIKLQTPELRKMISKGSWVTWLWITTNWKSAWMHQWPTSNVRNLTFFHQNQTKNQVYTSNLHSPNAEDLEILPVPVWTGAAFCWNRLLLRIMLWLNWGKSQSASSIDPLCTLFLITDQFAADPASTAIFDPLHHLVLLCRLVCENKK